MERCPIYLKLAPNGQFHGWGFTSGIIVYRSHLLRNRNDNFELPMRSLTYRKKGYDKLGFSFTDALPGSLVFPLMTGPIILRDRVGDRSGYGTWCPIV